jgi:hypothetical protein
MEPDDLQRVQEEVDIGAQTFAQALAQRTGLPLKALIVLVHFPNDIVFSAAMESAPPQAQMNAVDAMVKHIRKCALKMKEKINSIRHQPKQDS